MERLCSSRAGLTRNSVEWGTVKFLYWSICCRNAGWHVGSATHCEWFATWLLDFGHHVVRLRKIVLCLRVSAGSVVHLAIINQQGKLLNGEERCMFNATIRFSLLSFLLHTDMSGILLLIRLSSQISWTDAVLISIAS